MKGKVKFFNIQKGFGFIAGDDEQDYFAHISQIENNEELKTDMIVSFTPSENDRGKQAIKIKIESDLP